MAVAAAVALSVVGCAPEAPDYQAVWSTTSSPTSAAPTSTPSSAPVPIAAYLEQGGVAGIPVAPDRLTDLTVSIPTPPGWQRVPGHRTSRRAPG